MKEIIKERFKESFHHLYQKNHFKNKKAFAASLEISPQFLSQLLNKDTPVPLDLLTKFFKAYPVNPGFFFKEENNILIENEEIGVAGSGSPETALQREIKEVLTLSYNAQHRLHGLIEKLHGLIRD